MLVSELHIHFLELTTSMMSSILGSTLQRIRHDSSFFQAMKLTMVLLLVACVGQELEECN